jgi:hypothetical protein
MMRPPRAHARFRAIAAALERSEARGQGPNAIEMKSPAEAKMTRTRRHYLDRLLKRTGRARERLGLSNAKPRAPVSVDVRLQYKRREYA